MQQLRRFGGLRWLVSPARWRNDVWGRKRAVSTVCSSDHSEKPAEQPLVDTFGRHHDYLRISLTEKCNLRCELHIVQ